MNLHTWFADGNPQPQLWLLFAMPFDCAFVAASSLQRCGGVRRLYVAMQGANARTCTVWVLLENCIAMNVLRMRPRSVWGGECRGILDEPR
jgi:hypothetical protein